MKKLLLSTLLLFGLTFSSFSNGLNLNGIDLIASGNFTVPTITANYGFTSVYDTNNTDFKNYCIYIDNISRFGDLIIRFDSNASRTNSSTIQGGFILESSFDTPSFSTFNIFCTNGTRRYYGFSYPKASAGINFDYYIFNSSALNSIQSELSSCQSDINYLTGELDLLHQNLAQCQSDYATCDNDLNTCQNSSSCDYSGYILESEITTGYCETMFNMISPSDCPSSGSGDIQWSSFWVNNVQVMGGRNIYLFMPELFTWDYTYVEGDLQIDVENEGDPEYIDGIIENQTTLPNKTDLNNIITGIIPLFVPGLIIILFIYFIFRFIKKIF